MNVFLGIGLAWTIAAVYWMVVGKTDAEKEFKVDPGNLGFYRLFYIVLFK